MKKTFYFMLKAFFILDIFTFLSWLFSYVEKRPDKKSMVNFKTYDVTEYRQQIVRMHILSNISRSNGNQIKKFGQLIECNIRNIFLKISYIEHISESTVWRNVIKFAFIVCPNIQVKVYLNILKLSCWRLSCSLHKAFLKKPF